jgi:protein-disulfide reductase (glutathione)
LFNSILIIFKINLQDDEEPSSKDYQPDGGYIPRIFFVDPTGKVRSEIINKLGSPKYKYYYSSAEQVHQGMQSALKELKKVSEPTKKEDL